MVYKRLFLCLSLSLLSACGGGQALEKTEALGQRVDQTQSKVQDLREDVDQLALRVDLLEREGRFIKNGAVLNPVPGNVQRGGAADSAQSQSGGAVSSNLVGPVPAVLTAGGGNAAQTVPAQANAVQKATHGPQDPLISALPILPPGQASTDARSGTGAAASSLKPVGMTATSPAAINPAALNPAAINPAGLSTPESRPGVNTTGEWSPYSFGVKPNGLGSNPSNTAGSSNSPSPYPAMTTPATSTPSAAGEPALTPGASTAQSLQAMYPSPPMTEKSAYDTALRFYQSGRFKEAETAFNTFLKEFPKSKLVANALYWRGETYYARSDFRNAIFAFKDVQARYPQHSKTPDSLLKTAMAYEKLGDKENAALHLAVLIEDWPQSEASRRAEKMALKPR